MPYLMWKLDAWPLYEIPEDYGSSERGCHSDTRLNPWIHYSEPRKHRSEATEQDSMCQIQAI